MGCRRAKDPGPLGLDPHPLSATVPRTAPSPPVPPPPPPSLPQAPMVIIKDRDRDTGRGCLGGYRDWGQGRPLKALKGATVTLTPILTLLVQDTITYLIL